MRWFLSLLAALALVAAPAPAREQVSLRTLGVALVVPDGWERIANEEALTHIEDVEFDSPEFRLRRGDPTLPIVSVRKLGGDSALIPQVNVGLLPAAGFGTDDPLEIARRTAMAAGRAFSDTRILEGPSLLRISGLPAGHVRIGYSHVSDGVRYETISEFWAVNHGSYILIVGCGYSPDEPAATRAEILAMVDSIRLAPRR